MSGSNSKTTDGVPGNTQHSGIGRGQSTPDSVASSTMRRPAAALALILSIGGRTCVGSYTIRQYFLDTDLACEGTTTPFLGVVDEPDCAAEECRHYLSENSESGYRITVACTDDYNAYLACVSNRGSYLLQEKYTAGADCAESAFQYAIGDPATGDCTREPFTGLYFRAVVESNGSVSVVSYNDSGCGASLHSTFIVAADVITNGACDSTTYNSDPEFEWKFSIIDGGGDESVCASPSSSSSANSTTNSGINSPGSSSVSSSSMESMDVENEPSTSGISTGAVIGIIAGVVALMAIVFVLVRRRRRAKGKSSSADTLTGGDSGDAYLDVHALSTSGAPGSAPSTPALWDDDAITTSRIPREQIEIKQLLNRGAFGEVYLGIYDNERVAVKMLRSEMRKSVRHVNEFLAEVKLTASMEHPHIVRFIGVAWKVLADLCVVMEFMEAGDVRSLLNTYLEERAPFGFDRSKTTIAFHVCHALAYMHSLTTPVIHRDLKSRNILLTRELDAKLTDFGISREKLDYTMTGGVGTMLWMAPEVMKGDKYDDKADVFSFGVVLSELDVHTLPYAMAKERAKAAGDRPLGDTAVLRQVAMGKMSVEFSNVGPPAMAELGRECVRVNPADRPTAAVVLCRLQAILAKDLSS